MYNWASTSIVLIFLKHKNYKKLKGLRKLPKFTWVREDVQKGNERNWVIQFSGLLGIHHWKLVRPGILILVSFWFQSILAIQAELSGN